MASSFSSSSRKRASALTIAFGVLASGAVLTAAPAYAATTTPPTSPAETTPVATETATPTESTVGAGGMGASATCGRFVNAGRSGWKSAEPTSPAGVSAPIYRASHRLD